MKLQASRAVGFPICFIPSLLLSLKTAEHGTFTLFSESTASSSSKAAGFHIQPHSASSTLLSSEGGGQPGARTPQTPVVLNRSSTVFLWINISYNVCDSSVFFRVCNVDAVHLLSTQSCQRFVRFLHWWKMKLCWSYFRFFCFTDFACIVFLLLCWDFFCCSFSNFLGWMLSSIFSHVSSFLICAFQGYTFHSNYCFSCILPFLLCIIFIIMQLYFLIFIILSLSYGLVGSIKKIISA